MKVFSGFIINIFCPLLLGLLIYISAFFYQIPNFIRNYVPDILWAYAITFTLLIIWKYCLPFVWIFLLLLLFILFEVSQYFDLINGTGDLFDVFCYIITAEIILFKKNNISKK